MYYYLCSVTFKVNDVILLDGSDVVVVAVRMIVICMCSVSFRVLRGSACDCGARIKHCLEW